MPELPEIEAIRRGLQKQIVGLTSQNGQHFGSAQGLRGKKVLNIWRKAKILDINVVPANAGIQLKSSSAKLDSRSCKVCGEIIRKIQLGGRGTYFCPKCQK